MPTKTLKKMKNAVAWFEIPVKELMRAKKFYESILDVELMDMDMGDDFKMSMFPVEEGGVGGALCQNEFYTPSKDGTLVYFSVEPDLGPVLDRVRKNGGKVLNPKKKISDEYGYMAVFEDTEGNRLALHSMK